MRDTGPPPPVLPELNERVLRDNLNAHQQKLFNNTKLDLIRKLESESNLIGADRSAVRKDIIEQQKALIKEQKTHR